ncbi:uncharacterized protein METZ01_LOCUS310105, partial [marine metagenome]
MGLNIGRDHYCSEIIGVEDDRYKLSFRSSHFLGRAVGLQYGFLEL